MKKIQLFILCIVFLTGCSEPKDLLTVFQEFQEEHPDGQILDQIELSENAYIIYVPVNSQNPVAIARFSKDKQDGWRYTGSTNTFVHNETYTMAKTHIFSNDKDLLVGATLTPELKRIYIETPEGAEIQPKYFEDKKYWYFLWKRTTPSKLIAENIQGDIIHITNFR